VNNIPCATNVRYFSAVTPEDSTKISSTFSNGIDSIVTSEAVADAAAAVTVVPEKINIISSTLLQAVEHIHLFVGVPYWESILIVTVAMRVLLFPIAIKTVQSSSRLACMKPEMAKLNELMNNDPNKSDPNVMKNYQAEMKGLMVKHKVNPIRAMLWPFSQFPIFIGFFIALREMGAQLDVANGGAFWFPDLGAADPMYILPVLNALSFLVMIEIGADGIQANQANQFKWAMRAVSLVMIPATASLPSSLFMYWLPNNVLSILQTYLLKREALRKMFDIPKMPEQPPSVIPNPMAKIAEVIKSEKSQGLGAKAEIIGTTESKPVVKPVVAAATPMGIPAVTYSAPPNRRKAGSK